MWAYNGTFLERGDGVDCVFANTFFWNVLYKLTDKIRESIRFFMESIEKWIIWFVHTLMTGNRRRVTRSTALPREFVTLVKALNRNYRNPLTPADRLPHIPTDITRLILRELENGGRTRQIYDFTHINSELPFSDPDYEVNLRPKNQPKKRGTLRARGKVDFNKSETESSGDDYFERQPRRRTKKRAKSSPPKKKLKKNVIVIDDDDSERTESDRTVTDRED